MVRNYENIKLIKIKCIQSLVRKVLGIFSQICQSDFNDYIIKGKINNRQFRGEIDIKMIHNTFILIDSIFLSFKIDN